MPPTSTLHRLEGRRFINSREEVGFIPTYYKSSGIQVMICYYSVHTHDWSIHVHVHVWTNHVYVRPIMYIGPNVYTCCNSYIKYTMYTSSHSMPMALHRQGIFYSEQLTLNYA